MRPLRKIVVMLSSGEQFDIGLVHSLCYLNEKTLLLKVLDQDSCTSDAKTDLGIGEHSTCKIISIKTCNVISPKKILSIVERVSDIIIIPRNVPLEVHLWILTRKLIKTFKLGILNTQNRHRTKYISLAFIFKLSHYLFLYNPY